MVGVSHQTVDEQVHVFSFESTDESAVDSCFMTWYRHFCEFGQNEASIMQPINILLDFSRSGVPSVINIYHQLQSYQRDLIDHPPVQLAIVIVPQRDVIPQLQTCINLIDKQKRIQFHFFRPDEYTNALNWLRGA